MASLRSSDRNAADNDEYVLKAKAAIIKLGKGTLNQEAKADITALLQEFIKLKQSTYLATTTATTQAGTPQTTSNADTNRFDTIDQKLEDLKAMMATNTAKIEQLNKTSESIITNIETKTYAQAVATSTLPASSVTPLMTPQKRIQLEEAKKERSERTITVNAISASASTKETIRMTHPKDVTSKLQAIIDAVSDLDTKPVIRAINKLGTPVSAIRMQFRTKEEATAIRDMKLKLKWNDAYPGLEQHTPKYGVVVHGIPSEEIDFNKDLSDTIQQWEEENQGAKIAKVIPLRRREKPAAHQLAVIFTEDPQGANQYITLGFFLNKERLKTGKYTPHLHINQCYKCQGFGHRSTFCKRKEKCSKCGEEDHKATDCKATKPQCANCKGDHESWHSECEKRIVEGKRLRQLQIEGPHLYPC